MKTSEFPKFLDPKTNPNDHSKKVSEWKERVKSHEGGKDAMYMNIRNSQMIQERHGVDFMNKIIPELISKKEKQGQGEKVNILDVGGGLGMFAEEIRKIFGNKVNVYTTSLSKKHIRDARGSRYYYGLNPKMHPQDAKWRSVLELRDYEEFDLIIDTYGEAYYGVGIDRDTYGGYYIIDESGVENYLITIIKKLKPGGMSSIYPNPILEETKNRDAFIQGLKKDYNIEINFSNALRINKKENIPRAQN